MHSVFMLARSTAADVSSEADESPSALLSSIYSMRNAYAVIIPTPTPASARSGILLAHTHCRRLFSVTV